MHNLQPKHIKLKAEEVASLLKKFNISLAQLPKISKTDPAIPEDCEKGDVIKIQRKEEDQIKEYFRVVI